MTADKSKILTSSFDRSVIVLETETLKLVSRLSNAHTDLINYIAANAVNSNLICTAGQDGFVSLWDLRKGYVEPKMDECKYCTDGFKNRIPKYVLHSTEIT